MNATAHLVDSLYRNHRTKALIEHADDVLALLKHKLSGEDIGVGRELGLACMKLHGGLTQERGVEAAQYFVVKASKLWDTSRPPSDSVGIELLASLPNFSYSPVASLLSKVPIVWPVKASVVLNPLASV